MLVILAGCGFVALLIYVGFSKNPPIGVYADETKSYMKIIAVAITWYPKVPAAEGYAPLTPDNWVTQLASVPKSRKIIEYLPTNVWGEDRNTEFLDAWGNPIVFSPNSAQTGGPILTSAGPDGDITTKDDNILRFDK